MCQNSVAEHTGISAKHCLQCDTKSTVKITKHDEKCIKPNLRTSEKQPG